MSMHHCVADVVLNRMLNLTQSVPSRDEARKNKCVKPGINLLCPPHHRRLGRYSIHSACLSVRPSVLILVCSDESFPDWS